MYIKVLKTEFLKAKRTLALTGVVLLPAFIALVAFLVFYIKSEDYARMGMNMWVVMGQTIFGLFGALLLPVLTMIVCYSINHIEYEADAWKNLFVLPIKKRTIYLGKITFGILLILASFALLCLLTFGVGQLLSVLKPELGFQDYNSNQLLLIFFLKFFISIFGMFGIQFVVSIYWSDFIKPIGVGLAATVLGLMIASWKYSYLYPYSIPMRITQQFYKEDISILIKELGFSALFVVLFLVTGYFLILKKNLK